MSTSREKYENTRLRPRKKVIKIFTFFLNKNVWRGVTTYLCERDIYIALGRPFNIDFQVVQSASGHSPTGVEVSHNTGNMPGCVLGRQEPLTRLLEPCADLWQYKTLEFHYFPLGFSDFQ